MDDLFLRHVTDRLGKRVFSPREDAPEELAFAASLNSFRSLRDAGWAEGVNAAGQKLQVVAGYVEAMTPNAFAEAGDGVHFVGMHDALLVTMMDLALFAFTQRDLFPTIGAAEAEDSPRPGHGGVPGLYLLQLTLAGGSIETERDKHRVPKDADRHIMAVYLAMHMARFVWEHELAHCRLGHADFLNRHGAVPRLTETADTLSLVQRATPFVPGRSNGDVLHAFELEADAEALQRCLAIQLNDAENIPGIRAHDPGLRIQMAIVASYLMTWLFEAYARHNETSVGGSHPEPLTRLATLMSTTQSVLGTLDGYAAFHQGIIDQVEGLILALGAETRVRPALVPMAQPAQGFDALLAPYRYQAIS